MAEAAYCGCTVIASDIPGQNTMKDIPGIVWIPSEDVEALKCAVLDVLQEKAEKKDITEVQAYIAKHYSLEAWSEKIIEVYHQSK